MVAELYVPSNSFLVDDFLFYKQDKRLFVIDLKNVIQSKPTTPSPPLRF
jgi:hypothetical protein